MALSIAALSSAAPAVYGRGGLIQAIFPFVAGLGLLAGGVRCNRLGGGTDFVGVRPEAFASDFHIAMGYGIAAHAAPWAAAVSGALAAAAPVVAVRLLGLAATGASFGLALALFMAYGAALGLLKRRALLNGDFIHIDGRRYGAYRRLSVFGVPVIVAAWILISGWALDPFTILLIAGVLLWWIGMAFHWLWEILQTALLALVYRPETPRTIEWGLDAWLRHGPYEIQLNEAVYAPESKEARIAGRTPHRAAIESDLLRFGFVKSVTFAEPPAHGAAEGRL